MTQDKEQLEQHVDNATNSQLLPQISTDGITVAMPHVSLKDKEIKVLKEDNLKSQQERRSLRKAKQNLQQIVDKYKSKFCGKL